MYYKTLTRIADNKSQNKGKPGQKITGEPVGGACLIRCYLKCTCFIHFGKWVEGTYDDFFSAMNPYLVHLFQRSQPSTQLAESIVLP